MEYLYTSTYTTTITDVTPSFSLPQHVSVFNLACTLSITGLKAQSLQKYCYTLKNLVSNLSVYFTSVRTIYALPPKSAHPELRLAVVETAVLEMRNLLIEGSDQRKDFHLRPYHLRSSTQIRTSRAPSRSRRNSCTGDAQPVDRRQ